MNTLVLGGSQFVGLHLVQQLVARGHDVTVLNRGQTATSMPAGVNRLVADRTDSDSMRAALTGTEWDAVFDVSGFVQVSGKSDIHLLIDLLDGHVGAYVYTSSVMAYKQAGWFPWTEDMERNPDPSTTYGGFKVMVENAILERHRETGFPGSVVRPAAIYGPDNNIYDMEAPMFLRIMRGLPILVPHDGLVTCSYGHVDDLARVMIDMADNPAAQGEIFNITAEAVTVNEYVRVLSEIIGKPADVHYISQEQVKQLGRPPYGHLFGRMHHSMLSIEKAQRLLGFRNDYDFRTGHAQTFEWFMNTTIKDAEQGLRDPLWFASWDFENEAKAAELVRAAGQPA
jgi:nucleoside-diphosphate-sugar epimerase